MVKIIYYNSEQLNSIDLVNCLETLGGKVYKIKECILLCSVDMSSKELYDNIGSLVEQKNIFIADLSNEKMSYWGYMNGNLWDWLKNEMPVV